MADQGDTKKDLARRIYAEVMADARAKILKQFQSKAGLTEKGALTYYYSIKKEQADKA